MSDVIETIYRGAPPISMLIVHCHSAVNTYGEQLVVTTSPSGTSHQIRYKRAGDYALGEIFLNSDEIRELGEAFIKIADQNPL